MFFLGFFVHPAFSKTASSLFREDVQVRRTLRRNSNPFRAKIIVQAAQFYFEKWELYSDIEKTDEEKKALGKDFLDWMRKDESTM